LLEAPKLTRPLLLIHGLTDDNVFPANTLHLSRALLAAGRPHEVLLLSGATHHIRDETAFENLHWHQVRFLQQHLGAQPPGRLPAASAQAARTATQQTRG
jgi:dipeptidyl-peptidase 4